MATPSIWQTEQQSNTGAADTPSIFDPQIIGLSNGNILVTWSEFHTTGVGTNPGTDIIGKIFAGDGTTVVRDSYRINHSRTIHDEMDYDIAATNDGGFILVYVDNDSIDSRVVWERKNATGNNTHTRDIASENGTGDFDNPQVAVSNSNNSSFVTFTDLQTPVGLTHNDNISGVRLNSLGTIITSEFNAAENTSDNFRDADSAININGELVTVHRNITDGEIILEVRSTAGTLTHRTTVDNTGTPFDPQIATLTNGNIAVTWRDDSDDVNYAVYNFNLGAVLTKTAIDNTLAQQPEIVALPSGEFVVIWYQTSGSMSGRKYNADGTADGSIFSINSGGATSPNIGVTGDGRLLVTWEEGDNVSFEIWDPRDGNILAGTYENPALNFVDGDDIYANAGGGTIFGDNGTADNIIGDDGGVDYIYGNNGNDTINGYGGDDIIFGGSGNDSILGGAGLDTLFGDAGDDTIVIGAGRDSVIAGAGNDLIIVSAGDSIGDIDGGDGSDTLDHSNLYNGLFGGFYDVHLNFGTGSLTVPGGSTAAITNIETYIDNDGGNRISMGGDLTNVEAMGGNDTVYASTDAVTIDAGNGDDSVVATSGNSHLYDGGIGTDTVNLTYYNGNYQFNMTTGATGFLKTFLNFEDVLTGSGNDSITGTSTDNDILTGDGDDTILALAGDDRLRGGAGNDLLDGGAGFDTVSYLNSTFSDLTVNLNLTGAQTISADMGNDVLVSIEGIQTGEGNDLLVGNADDNYIFSNMGNDSIYGGAGSDTLISFWGDNLINGDAGKDNIEVGYGSDTVNGGDGNDLINAFYFGYLGQADVLNGDVGNDTIIASNNDDLIDGGAGNDSLDGNAGNDTILGGGGGNNTINGGAGDDSLDGQIGGHHEIYGGDGNDTIRGSNGDDWIEGNEGDDTIFGGIGDDTIYGGAGNDQIQSIQDNNYIDGGIGNDTISTFEGQDTLIGGDGDDTFNAFGEIYYNTFPTPHVNGGDGIDTLDYSLHYVTSLFVSFIAFDIDSGYQFDSTTGSYTNQWSELENFFGATDVSNHITGNSEDNVLRGANRNDTITGEAGNDTLEGGLQNDVLAGGAGNDQLDGGGNYDTADYSEAATDVVANINYAGAQNISATMGTDTFISIEGLIGGTGNDLLVGSSAGNVIDGGAGNDEIYGIGGSDILRGGLGNDQIEGSGGNDTMEGGAGEADILNYYNSAGGVTVDLRFQGTAQSVGGSSGTDIFTDFENLYGSNAGGDTLVGSTGNNRILGFGGGDQIVGFHGNDELIGMQGSDTLTGGQGADTLAGGGGADSFNFDSTVESNNVTHDTITDFGVGGADVIDLNTIDANANVLGDQAFNFIGSTAFSSAAELRFTTNGTDGFVLGDVDGNGTADLNILLLGVTSMSVSDFLL